MGGEGGLGASVQLPLPPHPRHSLPQCERHGAAAGQAAGHKTLLRRRLDRHLRWARHCCLLSAGEAAFHHTHLAVAKIQMELLIMHCNDEDDVSCK